jgi:hypothetical protein
MDINPARTAIFVYSFQNNMPLRQIQSGKEVNHG